MKNGFKGLQSKGNHIEKLPGKNGPKIKGGPVIVSYDEEDGDNIDYNQPNINKNGFSKLNLNGNRVGNPSINKSIELNGESEYLQINGNQVDVISEDQLDRLLIQAKQARSNGRR